MEERNQEDGGEQLLVISKEDLEAVISAACTATAHSLGGIEADKSIDQVSTGYDPTSSYFTTAVYGLQLDDGEVKTAPIRIRTLDGLPVRWNLEDYDPSYGCTYD